MVFGAILLLFAVGVVYATGYTQNISETFNLVLGNHFWQAINETFNLKNLVSPIQILTENFNLINLSGNIKIMASAFNLQFILGNFEPISETFKLILIPIAGRVFAAQETFSIAVVCDNCTLQQQTTTSQSPNPSTGGLNFGSANFFGSSNFGSIVSLIVILIFIFSPAFILLEITGSAIGAIFGSSIGILILGLIGIIPLWVIAMLGLVALLLIFRGRI